MGSLEADAEQGFRADDGCQGSRPGREPERRQPWPRGEGRPPSHVRKAQAPGRGGVPGRSAGTSTVVRAAHSAWDAGCPGGTGLAWAAESGELVCRQSVQYVGFFLVLFCFILTLMSKVVINRLEICVLLWTEVFTFLG